MDSELNVTQKEQGCCGGNCGCAADEKGTSSTTTIVEAVKEHYGKIAERAEQGDSNCCGVPSKLYSTEELQELTGSAVGASAGCGNPTGLADAKSGETVLDLGSGGGIDCFLAAKAVGETGNVIGVDMTAEMVKLARANATKMGVKNVDFKLGRIEAVPVPDATIDLVISNCVIALATDKDLVFQEIYRILKPGGRMIISDMVFAEEPAPELRQSLESWAECVGGADVKDTYLERIKRAGFEDVQLLEERVSDESELGESACGNPKVLSITVKAITPTI